MIVVIQCAATKNREAGHLRTADERKVAFVAHPDAAPVDDDSLHARPDDRADIAETWRTLLREYNEVPEDNPCALLPAWRLYGHKVYGDLARHFGPDRLYILSAGWGLLRADFLTPSYDITFRTGRDVAPYKRRRPRERYGDFRMLPRDVADTVVFLGGKDYVSFFCELTRDLKAPRHVFYASKRAPAAPGCLLQRFETTIRTNWHYACATALVEGRVTLDCGQSAAT